MSDKNNYWYAYYDAHTIARSDALRQEFTIEASGARLHLDAYLQPDPEAPMVLLNHGMGGYSRLFVGAALALYERGFSVLAADQRGHGFSSLRSRDFSLQELIQDVLDAAFWVRRNFRGQLFLAGVHHGSGLVFHAAGQGAPADGLILHHLVDFADPAGTLAASRFAMLAEMAGGVGLASGTARTLMALTPRFRLPIGSLMDVSHILDERDNGRYEAWLDDPHPARTVSMRYAVGMISTPPPLPYDANLIPALVINPLRDRAYPPEQTRRLYERLGGPKAYMEIDAGHWSLLPEFSAEWADGITGWVNRRA